MGSAVLDRYVGAWFLTPALVLLLFILVGPFAFMVWTGFTDLSFALPNRDGNFIGFDNFRRPDGRFPVLGQLSAHRAVHGGRGDGRAGPRLRHRLAAVSSAAAPPPGPHAAHGADDAGPGRHRAHLEAAAAGRFRHDDLLFGGRGACSATRRSCCRIPIWCCRRSSPSTSGSGRHSWFWSCWPGS